MSAFYFGPPGNQLFGYHHVAPPTSSRAVLLCPPWGSEYQYAHRTLRVLAKQLAGRGCHVMRFDYSATGDSWGDTTDADVERWVDETGEAVEELRAISGIERVGFVGLRLGAAIAARAASRLSAPGCVVLWDPIVDGEGWMAELGIRKEKRRGMLELDRSVVDASFLDQLRALGPHTFDDLPDTELLLVLTEPGVSSRPVPDLWDRPGVEHLVMEQPSPWVQDPSIWSGKVPTEAVRKIAEWLA